MNYASSIGGCFYSRKRLVPLEEGSIPEGGGFGYHRLRPSLLAFDAMERLSLTPMTRVAVVYSNPLLAIHIWRKVDIQQITALCSTIDEALDAEGLHGNTHVNFEVGEPLDPRFMGRFDVLVCDSQQLSASWSPQKLALIMGMLRRGGLAYFHCFCRNPKSTVVGPYLNLLQNDEKSEQILRLVNASLTSLEFSLMAKGLPDLISKVSVYQPLCFTDKNLQHHAISSKMASECCYGVFTAAYICERA